MCLAVFIIVIDTTIMNVAITALVHDLNTNIESIQFAIALYSLVIAAFTLTGGKLGDIIGMKRTFIIGTAIYGVGTIIAALCLNVLMLLVGWSIIEGIGAALMMPLTATLILVSYEGKERAVSFGVIGAMAAIGAAVGPIVGGFLTTYASWRWAFAMEVIVVVVVLAYSYLLTESEIDKRATLDYFGVSLSAIGLACIVFGIIKSTIGLIGVGIIVLILFFVWQKRQELKKKMPLVRLAIIKNALNTIHCHMQTGKTDQIKTPNERFTKEKISSIPNEYSGIRTNVKNLVITFSILLRFCFSFNNSRTRTGSSFMILSTPKSTYWLTSSLGLRDQICTSLLSACASSINFFVNTK